MILEPRIPTYWELEGEALAHYGQTAVSPREAFEESLAEWDRLSEQASILTPMAPPEGWEP